MNHYICSLEGVEYRCCKDELADLQADSVSNKYLYENGHKNLWIVKGHAVASRLAKHTVTRIVLPFSPTYLVKLYKQNRVTDLMSRRTLGWLFKNNSM